MKKKSLPTSDISPLMWVRTAEGIGTVHSSTILAVIPNVTMPAVRSLLITTAFPQGITVEGNAEDISFDWLDLVAEPEDDYEEDDDEYEVDEYDEFCEERCLAAASVRSEGVDLDKVLRKIEGDSEFDYFACGSPCGADSDPETGGC